LFRRLVKELPEDAKHWFPELAVFNGVLCYQRDGKFGSLENVSKPRDGVSASSWYRGDFMQFLNPHRLRVDKEELHATARWVEWSRSSRGMRKIQVDESIRNMKESATLLHRELLKNAAAEYPKGVDKMRCDHLAAAIAMPHLSPGQIGKAVWALKQRDVLAAFAAIEYGPGDREKSVVEGVMTRGKNLSGYKYSLAQDQPVWRQIFHDTAIAGGPSPCCNKLGSLLGVFQTLNNPPRFPPSTAAPMIATERNTIDHTPNAAANSVPFPNVLNKV
jgi:hypothetical protein